MPSHTTICYNCRYAFIVYKYITKDEISPKICAECKDIRDKRKEDDNRAYHQFIKS